MAISTAGLLSILLYRSGKIVESEGERERGESRAMLLLHPRAGAMVVSSLAPALLLFILEKERRDQHVYIVKRKRLHEREG